ncbi:MAG TPA: 2OG-Fe(II) oxygenase [Hanamia sp.]|nr:2OG-Fe(II) oxygenase [Hanamia sp.]
METIFNTLIETFIENKVGVTENFLNATLASKLRSNLLSLYSQNKLRLAGTGNGAFAVRDKSMRSDMIYWLDRKNNNEAENAFFDLIDAFVSYLNSTCYTGITGYEFHYTLYEKGSFYKKHIDQFANNKSRQYSMIFYLNEDWQPEDGGELRIYYNDKVENISPLNGKSVFFKSIELAHEVLVAYKPRMSITGWLKKD